MNNKIPTQRDVIPKWAAYLLVAIPMAFCAALLTGCGKGNQIPSPKGILIEQNSGCEWVAGKNSYTVGYRVYLTPNVDANGLQVCKSGAALMVGAK